MTKETRKALRQAILDQLNDDMMPLKVDGHEITDQLVYAGCSQWSCAGREWEETQSAWAYIVDGEYQLTYPKLDYFNGHNQIEQQTKYYLQPDRAETPPDGPIGEPLRRVPDSVLLEIASGLAVALATHNARHTAEDQEAIALTAKLLSAQPKTD